MGSAVPGADRGGRGGVCALGSCGSDGCDGAWASDRQVRCDGLISWQRGRENDNEIPAMAMRFAVRLAWRLYPSSGAQEHNCMAKTKRTDGMEFAEFGIPKTSDWDTWNCYVL